MLVYLLTNIVNGKKYVGQTVQTVKQRWNSHLSKTKRGSTLPICNAIRKYGKDKFDLSVLIEVSDKEELNQYEQRYITEYRSNDPVFGYNLAAGGNGNSGWVHSEESKARISKAKTGRSNGLKGATVSLEHRQRLSQALKGRKFSTESLQKMGASQLGKKRGPRSEETKRKIRLALKGHPPFSAGYSKSEAQ